MTIDIGFTHIALSSINLDESISFYSKYANMSVIHERIDAESARVIWLSDKTRPFVIVLLQNKNPETILNPLSHLGVGCVSTQEVDRLCDMAKQEGALVREPQDSGYPIGYWALLQDPTGHTLELSYGQEIGLTVSRADQSARARVE
jgi:catechol 2,3-dioxygenase-like lactoylglutathione lyase family enzyme